MSSVTEAVSSQALLEARNLVREFQVSKGGAFAGTETFRAVDQVSLALHAGRTTALVGESGSGKSTTARMIAKLLDVTSGTMHFEGEDVTRASDATLRRFRANVQVVFQDPFSSLNPKHTVDRIIAAPLDYQGIRGVDRRVLVKTLLERVGLNPDHSSRYPSQFSGGQAQRIGIARALAVEPKLVICDEAVSALDVSVQAQVINLLRDLQQESGYSYLFIAHDLAVVRQIADDVAVMSSGKIVEQGTTAQVFDNPTEEYTQALLSAVPVINPEWEVRRQQTMGRIA
ncbi:peptide ABC transporter ATP-binding protein [Arthrobacter sp. MYb227]|uniref:ATP-binding cassette domain-containing protein n=1 Tax=Arthrobacter sp. MYb227 TaxID=1848601 RepID=UPI000CFB64F3|nr:ATP-binding cassette domain-containing protein [Arthrobacter sp. MYb227]PQZ94804.1 peptide ABC transporter ATP-binding protein [Arthrobacter sp. MYb227]